MILRVILRNLKLLTNQIFGEAEMRLALELLLLGDSQQVNAH